MSEVREPGNAPLEVRTADDYSWVLQRGIYPANENTNKMPLVLIISVVKKFGMGMVTEQQMNNPNIIFDE